MKRYLTVLAVSVVAVLGSRAQDARDGLVAWWVPLGDVNGNGVVDPEEIVDLVNYTTAASPSCADAVTHMTADGELAWEKARPIVHDTYTGKLPMGQVQAADEPVILFQAATNKTDDGTLVGNPQSITLPCGNMPIGDKLTMIVTGIKPICRICKNGNSWQYTPILSYDFSTSKHTGMSIGYQPQGAQTSSYNAGYLGYRGVYMPVVSTTDPTCPSSKDNCVYDLGVSFERNTPQTGYTRVVIFTRRNDYNVGTTGMGNRLWCYTNVTDKVSVWSTADSAARKLVLGNLPGVATTSYATNDAALATQYHGPVRFVKIYNRAISPMEFDEACLAREDPLWSIGTRNNAANEFSDALAETTFDAETMPWRKFRKTLTAAHPSVSVSCNLLAADRNIPRVLQLKPLATGGFTSGTLDVAVNGTKVGSIGVKAGKESLFFLKTRALQLTTKVGDAYPLTLTLTRTGTIVGDLSFDWLALQGGWQIGVQDDSYGDFATWGKPWSPGSVMYNFRTYYLGQRELKTLCGQMQSGGNSGDNQRWFRFELTDEMAANCAFTFGYRQIGLSCTNEVYVNGVKKLSAMFWNKSERKIDFAKSELKGGVNEIYITTDTTLDNFGPDFVRLTPIKKWKDGFLILFR